MVFEQVTEKMQKSYGFWASYSKNAKKDLIFEQVTTLQKSYGFWASYSKNTKIIWFLRKLQ